MVWLCGSGHIVIANTTRTHTHTGAPRRNLFERPNTSLHIEGHRTQLSRASPKCAISKQRTEKNYRFSVDTNGPHRYTAGSNSTMRRQLIAINIFTGAKNSNKLTKTFIWKSRWLDFVVQPSATISRRPMATATTIRRQRRPITSFACCVVWCLFIAKIHKRNMSNEQDDLFMRVYAFIHFCRIRTSCGSDMYEQYLLRHPTFSPFFRFCTLSLYFRFVAIHGRGRSKRMRFVLNDVRAGAYSFGVGARRGIRNNSVGLSLSLYHIHNNHLYTERNCWTI